MPQIGLTMETLEQVTAKKLLLLKAFRIQSEHPFTWGNGWQAPIYFDDRKILSYPKAMAYTRLGLANAVVKNFEDYEVIAGIAVNAIAFGLMTAESLNLPFVYVYPTPKDHGLENQIEGDLRPRQNVVVIENQVSVGDHAAKVIESLRNAGCKVLGVVSLFDYQLPSSKKIFSEVGVDHVSLTNFETVLSVGQELNLIRPEDVKELQRWHRSPAKWNKK